MNPLDEQLLKNLMCLIKSFKGHLIELINFIFITFVRIKDYTVIKQRPTDNKEKNKKESTGVDSLNNVPCQSLTKRELP